MKIKPQRLPKEERERSQKALYIAAGAVTGKKAMERFLSDLMTESERIMLGRRILIARELLAGARHDDIVKEMDVGYDTIANVQEWLQEQMPGYKAVVLKFRPKAVRKKIPTEKQRIAKIMRDQSFRGMFAEMKLRYPMHFLLFPWPEEHKPIRKYKKDSK